MIKNIIATAVVVLVTSGAAHCQDTLDTEKYKEAELFTMKKGYDVQQRLQDIEAIVGKEVTIYEVAGKQNRIKLTYTGIAEMANYPNISDKAKATLITVKTKDASGRMGAYFPLTNRSDYRIYLTAKMK